MKNNVVDINGDAVDLNMIITMIMDIRLDGESDGEFWFLSMHQYMFEDTEDRMAYYFNCDPVDYLVLQKHYRVIIEEEDFYIPADFCTIEGRLRATWEQSFYTWMEKKADQPRNVIEAYKKITGIDLSKRNEIQHDGYELYIAWLKNRKEKTKIPYRTEQDSPDDQTY